MRRLIVLAASVCLAACTTQAGNDSRTSPENPLALYCASATPIYLPKDTARIECGVRQIQNSDDVRRFCKVTGTRIESDSAYAKALEERNQQWQRLCKTS